MGMTSNQLALVRYVAENNIQKAKDAALCCCAEDTTQKNHYAVTKYQSLLRSGGMNLMETSCKYFRVCHDGRSDKYIFGKQILFNAG